MKKSLKYNLNKSLPEELKSAYPNIIGEARPEPKTATIPDPFWISGFVSGDSTFSVSIENSTSRLGKRVRLIFGTCLHIRDKDLLVAMGNYFNNLNFNGEVDNVKETSVHCTKTTCLLQIKTSSEIEKKVIPFFNKYPILGVKELDF